MMSRNRRRWHCFSGTIPAHPRIGRMPLHWFNSPIYVSTAKKGERYAVTNAERAAEFLLSWREHSREEAWRAAVSACMACMKGDIETERARKAFEAAARSIGHLL